MFHLLADDTGASAVWVAQRVPDDHITAVANQFVIGQIDLADTANFMASGKSILWITLSQQIIYCSNEEVLWVLTVHVAEYDRLTHALQHAPPSLLILHMHIRSHQSIN